jgi:hypothetical protein
MIFVLTGSLARKYGQSVLHHQVVSAPLRLVRSPTHPSGAAVEASGFVVGLESERCVESIPHLPDE